MPAFFCLENKRENTTARFRHMRRRSGLFSVFKKVIAAACEGIPGLREPSARRNTNQARRVRRRAALRTGTRGRAMTAATPICTSPPGKEAKGASQLP